MSKDIGDIVTFFVTLLASVFTIVFMANGLIAELEKEKKSRRELFFYTTLSRILVFALFTVFAVAVFVIILAWAALGLGNIDVLIPPGPALIAFAVLATVIGTAVVIIRRSPLPAGRSL